MNKRLCSGNGLYDKRTAFCVGAGSGCVQHLIGTGIMMDIWVLGMWMDSWIDAY